MKIYHLKKVGKTKLRSIVHIKYTDTMASVQRNNIITNQPLLQTFRESINLFIINRKHKFSITMWLPFTKIFSPSLR
jgi:hypothetical protein